MNSWIRGIICVSAICGIALALTPKGRVKTAEKLICGIIIISAIFSPILGIDSGSYAASIAEYSELAEKISMQGKENAERLNRTLIEDELSAYILDKAENIGVQVSNVSVELRWSDDGYWYPVGLDISGVYTEEQRLKLGMLIEADLGISSDDQSWTEVYE